MHADALVVLVWPIVSHASELDWYLLLGGTSDWKVPLNEIFT